MKKENEETPKKRRVLRKKKTTKEVEPKTKPKINKEEFLKKLIKPTKGASAESKISDLKNAKVNDKNQLIIDGQSYKLTPKGIFWAALDAHYKIGGDMNKFHDFMKELLQHLSMLASNNTIPDMFGHDFNDFFEIFVKTMNLCGEMKKKLDENDIEFDVKKYLSQDIFKQLENEDSEDKPEDSDDSTDEDKPKGGKPKRK